MLFEFDAPMKMLQKLTDAKYHEKLVLLTEKMEKEKEEGRETRWEQNTIPNATPKKPFLRTAPKMRTPPVVKPSIYRCNSSHLL
jgi:hypothetical protein